MNWALLDGLTDDVRRDVLARARRRRFGRNEVIFHEGDPGESLHLLAQGHVGIRIHTPLGDIATMRILRPGEFFGELALVSPAPRNATAVALEGAETAEALEQAMTAQRSDLDEWATKALALLRAVERADDEYERKLDEALISYRDSVRGFREENDTNGMHTR